MRALLPAAAAVVAAVLVAGCFGGAKPSESGSAARPAGPGALVQVHDLGPHDATIVVTVTQAGGNATSQTFKVVSGADAERWFSTAASGPVHVRVDYSWSEASYGAAGHEDAQYDAAGCAGAYRLQVTVDTTTDHTSSRAGHECLPS